LADHFSRYRFSVLTVGVIVMIAGVVISSVVIATSRPSAGAGHDALDRQVARSDGRSSLLPEEMS
jgi:hypothetical protein